VIDVERRIQQLRFILLVIERFLVLVVVRLPNAYAGCVLLVRSAITWRSPSFRAFTFGRCTIV
jgi:hypothetical protein